MFDDTGYVPNVWSWTLNDLTYPHYFQSSFCWLLELVASPCPTLLGLCRLVLVNPIQKWMDRIFTSQRIPADRLTGFLECERQRCRAWTNTTVADLYRVRICFRIYIIIYIYIYMLRNIHKGRGQKISQAGSQKDRCRYCCPPEQIPNVDLLWWLPQPQTDRCPKWGHSYGSHAPRPRGKHNPFSLECTQ